MPHDLILASGSQIRRDLLENAGVAVTVVPARVDEAMLRDAMIAEAASPRDIADALAEQKARKVAQKYPDSLVLGCDQVLDAKGVLLSKPNDRSEVRKQLQSLHGKTHSLLSAAVLYENASPVWRHVGQVRLHMHMLSNDYIDAYIDRNWDSIRHSVGGYKLEEEGARLFSRIEGDHFTVLGLPLLELLSYLALKGVLPR